ncbi:hypothetical protein LN042_10315 [Kitasatospora sp. RB6PN24]|uniref:hypothetical protein n=1 Tax=Kitasatospora humi TaxID=2893891 RepID=UPI001E5A506F|nr:hypothetical protein [Kitasatospora humi]MCC9307491.1 hypothetical protein [Kitasatospora humi]
MNELSFRGRDRLRPSWSRLALWGGLVGVQELLVASRLGVAGFFWVLGVTVALIVAGFYVSSRSWTTVGAAGITICWGIGPAKTHPWQEIRWIDVRETGTQAGTAFAPRIFLHDGRRRILPGLAHNTVCPYPGFAADFQRIVTWWELSTEPATRSRPSAQLRDRLSPGVVGLILGVVIVIAVFVIVAATTG